MLTEECHQCDRNADCSLTEEVDYLIPVDFICICLYKMLEVAERAKVVHLNIVKNFVLGNPVLFICLQQERKTFDAGTVVLKPQDPALCIELRQSAEASVVFRQ